MHARGTFEIKMAPLTDSKEWGAFSLLSIDKQFAGDLVGSSEGQMLATDAVEGSAGYVALERVRGALAGREGSFVLQHRGIMDRGAPSLDVFVVPDSGTDELAGLTGTMRITNDGGTHGYEFDYSLPA